MDDDKEMDEVAKENRNENMLSRTRACAPVSRSESSGGSSVKNELKSLSISPDPLGARILCIEDPDNPHDDDEMLDKEGDENSSNRGKTNEKDSTDNNCEMERDKSNQEGTRDCEGNAFIKQVIEACEDKILHSEMAEEGDRDEDSANKGETKAQTENNASEDKDDGQCSQEKEGEKEEEEKLSSEYFRRMARTQPKKQSSRVNLGEFSFGLNFSQQRQNRPVTKEESRSESAGRSLPPLIDHRKRTRRDDDGEGQNAFKKLFAGAKRNSNISKEKSQSNYSKNSSNKKRYRKNVQEDSEEEYEDEGPPRQRNEITTALDYLLEQSRKTRLKNGLDQGLVYGANKQKSLGSSKPSALQPFKPPISSNNGGSEPNIMSTEVSSSIQQGDEWLRKLDPKLVETIENEIMETSNTLHWDDIAGLAFVKRTIEQIVVMPMLRPDIFKGLRAPPKGLLLFGPPGTGKTLIGKCIASQSGSTFFLISASSLTSKWVGEGEKLVRALFAVARARSPSVIFIDEIDSLLSTRNDADIDSTRKMKTEFLVQLDGANVAKEERLLIVGATNRPQDLDEAVRRRLQKRLYVPLPDEEARAQIIRRLMIKERHTLSASDYERIASETSGYSGADVAQLCQEAALGPLQSLSADDIVNISPDDVRPINVDDFVNGLDTVKASVADADLDGYSEWNRKFGAGR